jgi:hypothetical protein
MHLLLSQKYGPHSIPSQMEIPRVRATQTNARRLKLIGSGNTWRASLILFAPSRVYYLSPMFGTHRG